MNFKKYSPYIFGAVALASVILVILSFRKKSGGKNKNPKKLLFVGDSVTAIKNYANNTPIKYTYPNFLKEDLEPKGYTIDVLAKGGEETKWMLKNLPEQLKNNKYDRIYIYGGANDGQNNVPLEKYLSNMEQMIKLGKDSGADVYVLAGFDNSKTIDPNKVGTTIYVPTKEEMYKRWQRWMDWQKRLPNLLKSADKVIPIVEIPKEYVPDGLHPSVKGAKMLSDYIKKTI
jgi:lysophospholipase L1-like esterase